MSNQVRTDRYRQNVSLPIDVVAKIRTFVRGKMVMAESFGGRRVLHPYRPMTVGDAIQKTVEEKFGSMTIDKVERIWMNRQRLRIENNRKEQDKKVREGKYRIPEDQKKKPGRKKGFFYPPVIRRRRRKSAE